MRFYQSHYISRKKCYWDVTSNGFMMKWEMSSLWSSAPVTAYLSSISLTSGWCLRKATIARNWLKFVCSLSRLTTFLTSDLKSLNCVGGMNPLGYFNLKCFIFSSSPAQVKEALIFFILTVQWDGSVNCILFSSSQVFKD